MKQLDERPRLGQRGRTTRRSLFCAGARRDPACVIPAHRKPLPGQRYASAVFHHQVRRKAVARLEFEEVQAENRGIGIEDVRARLGLGK